MGLCSPSRRNNSEFAYNGAEFYGIDKLQKVEELDTVVDEIV
jgi:hypothetical protein